jgi:cyclophilin family peptidyl-prolyl cis-trans isomerase
MTESRRTLHMLGLILSLGILVIIVGSLVTKSSPQESREESLSPLLPKEVSISTPSSMTLNQENFSETLQATLAEIQQAALVTATLATSEGTIELVFDHVNAPLTVANFVALSREGFYNETRFHRIIEGFMIQGGDPQSRDVSLSERWGTGGPGYQFPDEIHAKNANSVGTIAMANAGPNTNGSQFFINVADNNFLNTRHTVFGRVSNGYEIVEAMSRTATGLNDRPAEDIIINAITVTVKNEME